MRRRAVVSVSGSLLSVTGVIILAMAGSRVLMDLFGGQPLAAPEVGDPAWVGVGFTRVCGAALASLGLVMMTTNRLPDEAARALGGPIFAGLALLTLVTIIQAQAIWSSAGGWVLAAIVLVGCVGATALVKLRPGSPPA